jgi:hypothetical protein
MFEEVTYNLENAPAGIYDLDLTPSGNWIAVTERGESQHLSFGGKQIRLPKEIWFPMVRALQDDTALVVDSRAGRELNGWIIDSDGEVIRNFYAGDAIEDILVSDRFIVVSYFDESALFGGMEGNGVVIFDNKGNYEFGYRELFGEQAVDIADCYCTCWADTNRILFFPYTDFPLVSLDLETKTQKIWERTPEVAGSNAITYAENNVFFHSPYRDEHGVWKWELGQSSATRIGEYKGSLRGLRPGQFLGVRSAGYSVLAVE